MIDRLPMQLTEGVVATPDGLVFSALSDAAVMFYTIADKRIDVSTIDEIKYLWGWNSASKSLAYQTGKPWVGLTEDDDGKPFIFFETGFPSRDGSEYEMDRKASILVDNPDQYVVLHWCINNVLKLVERDFASFRDEHGRRIRA